MRHARRRDVHGLDPSPPVPTSQTPYPALAARLAALAAGCALAVATLYLAAVRTENGQRYDDRALIGALITEGDAVQQFERLLRSAAMPSLALGAIALGLLALRRGGVPLLLAVEAVLVGANGSSQVMKEVLIRPVEIWSPLQEPSFPSGHAMVPVSLACALLLVLRPADRAFAALVAIPVAAAAGVGVVAFAWHRPSDSIAAVLVATAWTAASAAVLVRGGRVAPAELRRGGWTPARRAAAAAVLAATGAAGVWFTIETVQAPVYEGIRFGLYHLAGSTLIVTVTAGLLGGLAYALRDLDFTARRSVGRERARAGAAPLAQGTG